LISKGEGIGGNRQKGKISIGVPPPLPQFASAWLTPAAMSIYSLSESSSLKPYATCKMTDVVNLRVASAQIEQSQIGGCTAVSASPSLHHEQGFEQGCALLLAVSARSLSSYELPSNLEAIVGEFEPASHSASRRVSNANPFYKKSMLNRKSG
jgi:hypothetical protein